LGERTRYCGEELSVLVLLLSETNPVDLGKIIVAANSDSTVSFERAAAVDPLYPRVRNLTFGSLTTQNQHWLSIAASFHFAQR
jgi:hypothetical protein